MPNTKLDSRQAFATLVSSIPFLHFGFCQKILKLIPEMSFHPYISQCIFFKNRNIFLQAHNEVNQTIIRFTYLGNVFLQEDLF